MFLKSPDILFGQGFRKATHVRRFYKAVQRPRDIQMAKLMSIVRRNENTAFGNTHCFEKIHSYADFARYVPVSCYEDLQQYIDKLRQGEKNQLTAEEPFMFATTSGTTAQPKFIPVTEEHLRDYTHAFQVHNYHLIKDFPGAAMGKFLIIASNDEEGHMSCGLPYGAVSGLLNRRQPAVIKKHFAVPYEICKIKDVDLKYYLMLRVAITQPVTAILGCNPSSLLLLANQLEEHAGDLIADIANGTINSSFRPPELISSAFAPYLKANKRRALEIEKAIEQTGTITPKLVWPDLAVLSCWKGGPMSFYLEKLSEFYGEVPVRDFGYMASEGRGSIPLSDAGAGGAVAITSHFFEFVEESDIDSANPSFLTVDQLKLHQRYHIFFTTSAGLYRYNINDVVEVAGFLGATPIIEFVRKSLGISSITGEKLTEEQVLVALTQAVRMLNLAEVSHFTAEVELGHPPHYVCFAELSTDLPDTVKSQFIYTFDQFLKLKNLEYEDKRTSKRLGLPELRILPTGTYKRLRQQLVSQGAPEAQVKIPFLSSHRSFSSRLELLLESSTS